MKAVRVLELYIVVKAKMIVLYSYLGYGTLGCGMAGRLKKRSPA